MITGRVTHTPEAIVTIKVAGPTRRAAEIETVLDTGFTDYLTLPSSLITGLNLPGMDTIECQLADGRIVSMESFLAVISWNGVEREILVLAADGDPLLGMSMLLGSRLSMDIIENGEVRIDTIA